MKYFSFITHIHFSSVHLLRVLCGKVNCALRSKREGTSSSKGSITWKTHQKNGRMEVNYNRVDINEQDEISFESSGPFSYFFYFSYFSRLCKIIRNKRKICWMPSHSLLEQENKPFQIILWFAVSGRIVHCGES